MEELEKNEVMTVEYSQPKFWHRIMANFVDFGLFVFSFIGFFFGARTIVQVTPDYKAMEQRENQIQVDSGLYVYFDSRGRNYDIIYYLDATVQVYGSEWDGVGEGGSAPSGKIGRTVKAINTFITYCETNASPATYQELVNYYDSFRLEKTYNNINYFIKDSDDKVVPNPTLADVAENRKLYYSEVYKPFIEKYAIPFLEANVKEYAALLRTDFNLLVFLEIPVSYALAIFHVYFIPPLFFKRGRKTLGKALYHIGLVDSRILSPTLKRFTVRFLILLFLEYMLSLVSFGIPFIISFSMMVFSKRKQGFPDYMLKLQEVDTSKANIYMDYVEAQLKNEMHGPAIDFQMKKPL